MDSLASLAVLRSADGKTVILRPRQDRHGVIYRREWQVRWSDCFGLGAGNIVRTSPRNTLGWAAARPDSTRPETRITPDDLWVYCFTYMGVRQWIEAPLYPKFQEELAKEEQLRIRRLLERSA